MSNKFESTNTSLIKCSKELAAVGMSAAQASEAIAKWNDAFNLCFFGYYHSNKHVSHLAKCAKKYRTRKKNLNRIQKYHRSIMY